MAKVATILCKKCRAPKFCVPERNLENAWLFEKCKLLGVEILVAGETMHCGSCGQEICIPVELVDSLVRGTGIDCGPEGPSDRKR